MNVKAIDLVKKFQCLNKECPFNCCHGWKIPVDDETYATTTQTFDENLSGLGIGSWTCSRGGYFISFDSLPGCAAAIVDKAKKAGVKLTPAGATWPYHHDPNDSNIRIAPTYPPMEDLKTAANLFTLCVRMVSAEKLLKEKKEAVPVSEKNEI